MSFLRANRWWLPVVPIALVAMLAASSYRVKTFWWESGLHHEAATASVGRYVHVVDDFGDQLGPTRRTYDVRADGIEQLDTIPTDYGSDTGPVPAGVTAWRVDLAWRAKPDQDLQGCRVLLVDADGARYGGDENDPLQQVYPCVPEDRPGPSSPLVKGDVRGKVEPGKDRPAEWRTHPIVLARKGVTPRAVWITFSAPDYVVLPLPR